MNYEELSLQELKDLAKEKGLKNISKLKKEDLINFLNESIIKHCERINIENDINITNIENIDPKTNTDE